MTAHPVGNLTVAFTSCPAEYAAVVVLLRHQSARVLVRHRRRAWEFPGGWREPWEGWANTARRDALEEAGAALRDLRCVGWYARPVARKLSSRWPQLTRSLHRPASSRR